MKSAKEFEGLLKSLDGQKYGAYKKLQGSYQFRNFQLSVDHIQVDPYAPPSKMRVNIKRETAGIPAKWLDTKDKAIAVSDFLTRTFGEKAQPFNKETKGSGTNGKILIDRCGQEILERTSVIIKENEIEARFEVGLPAAGRKILGKEASRILTDVLPQIVEQSLLYRNLNQKALQQQVTLMLDQVFIREELAHRNLVAFVANDSILPRRSGVSDKPLKDAVVFKSPENFTVEMHLPSGRTITGMGIPEGVSLIVGGGFHGKSTLLHALERGGYYHIAGDGREMIITRQDAVKVRAEDGRSIEKVNISAFINNLPGKKDTTQFSTENASGSTSQAANVVEALEAESSLLLIDEDTSATNFMIRDSRMQELVASEKEPITPFTNKVRPLYDTLNVSTILIVGGSGDYFDVADQILMMDEYCLKDVTNTAKSIANSTGYQRQAFSQKEFGRIPTRIPLKSSFSHSGKEQRLKAQGRHKILYGHDPIDISGLEQLVDDSQTNCIARMIDFFQNHILDEKKTLIQATDQMYNYIEDNGLDAISPYSGHPGNLALPRKQEFCAALNRYRGLKIRK
ncbi:ABC-ATPase domain-containing protein [Tetragenococcus muriaticus]|uniref:ABC-ATPase domain-containing protein n=1 Tax=Tetragenococcus muriaticus TaxID=64642 RepID=UPI000406ADFB|nr:ABC-ATPase domain-containing protein [Tetragenococcus muriaticus]GMA47595.1 ATPase [Tetragenococcus muriaticus]